MMSSSPLTTSLPERLSLGVDARVGAFDGMRWSLTRNCSLSPRATAMAYALLCAVSLVIAVGFLAAGFGIVLVFCGLELLAVGVALLVWGRHVGEGEVISLHAGTVCIDCCRCAARDRVELPLAWTRVIEEDARVLLAYGARRVVVGTQVDWPRRHRFALELRRALASSPATPMHAPT